MTTSLASIDRNALEELVSHVEVLVNHHDSNAYRSDITRYSSERCKELLSKPPLNGDRFTIQRKWFRYRIWDANKQGYWSVWSMGSTWSTCDRRWAEEKVRALNEEHKKLHAEWRNASVTAAQEP